MEVAAITQNVTGVRQSLPYSHLNMSDYPNCTGCNGSFGDYYDDGVMSDIMFYIILWQYVTPTLFGIILVVGISGNALVLYVILSQKAMRTVTNILLLNLAISDISFLLITVPFTAYKYVASGWDFGDTFCKLMKFFLYVSAYVTVWTLVAISGYRYLTVVRANSSARYRTRANIIVCCLCIWGVSLGSQVPVLLAHTLKTVAGGYTYCGVVNSVLEAVLVSFFVGAYIIPLLLICILYVPIMLHLRENKATSTLDNAHAKERTARACKVGLRVELSCTLYTLKQISIDFLCLLK
jgi:allatostatin receptor